MACVAQSTGAPVSPSAALRGAPSWAVYQSNTSAAQGGSSAPTVQLLAPLVEDGARKVLEGSTSVLEVLRVCRVEEQA